MADESEDAFTLLERDIGVGTRLQARDTEVAVEAGIVAHAIDSVGRRHLLVPVRDDSPAIDDTSSRGVNITTHTLVDKAIARRYIDVTCELPQLRDLFAVVCDEMLLRIRETPSSPGSACKLVIDRWRDLLAPAAGALLSRQALVGLLAELHLLESIAKVRPDRALQLWTGPDKARFDFSAPAIAVEVKATTLRSRLEAEIHGVTQLEEPPDGELYLRIEKFEPVPSGADSVPASVVRLMDLGVDANGLTRALNDWGYSVADTDAYAKIQFRKLEERTYLVNDTFPRIVPTSFVERRITERVINMRYTIDLTAEPPVPLKAADVAVLLSRIVA